MLTGIPSLHYFKSKNLYTGCHCGMRYQLSPEKRSRKDKATGEQREESVLAVTVWPDPWALDATDPALCRTVDYPLTEEGLRRAVSELAAAYEAERERWDHCPGILDCAPWSPPGGEREA